MNEDEKDDLKNISPPYRQRQRGFSMTMNKSSPRSCAFTINQLKDSGTQTSDDYKAA